MINRMTKKKSKILVLQGVPASGKSTYARELAEKDESYVIVNRDSIRESRGNYWIPKQEDYISDIEEFEVRAAINRKLNVVIDATNLNPKTIEKWNLIAQETESDIEFKLFEISFEEAMKRDSDPSRKRPVGEKTMKTFFRKYFPDKLTSMTDTRLILEPESSKPNVILCDIDGTVALRKNRSPFDYSKVSEDIFDPRMKLLLQNQNTDIIFLSGREGTSECKKDTEEWLKSNGIKFKDLLMRKPKDFRPDNEIKLEIYENQIKPIYNVVSVFEDRDKVVKMWRDLGILCCQVYYGNF